MDTAYKQLQGDRDIGNGKAEHIKTDLEMDIAMSKEMIKRTAKLGNSEVELALQLKEAREFMEWSSHHIKRDWLDLMDQVPQLLKEIQQSRMALTVESKKIQADIKDIRDIMADPETHRAIRMLENLVSSLEVIRSLRDNGAMQLFVEALCRKV